MSDAVLAFVEIELLLTLSQQNQKSQTGMRGWPEMAATAVRADVGKCGGGMFSPPHRIAH
jgi:hypothetical protein